MKTISIFIKLTCRIFQWSVLLSNPHKKEIEGFLWCIIWTRRRRNVLNEQWLTVVLTASMIYLSIWIIKIAECQFAWTKNRKMPRNLSKFSTKIPCQPFMLCKDSSVGEGGTHRTISLFSETINSGNLMLWDIVYCNK